MLTTKRNTRSFFTSKAETEVVSGRALMPLQFSRPGNQRASTRQPTTPPEVHKSNTTLTVAIFPISCRAQLLRLRWVSRNTSR